jgi:hypothetical protein
MCMIRDVECLAVGLNKMAMTKGPNRKDMLTFLCRTIELDRELGVMFDAFTRCVPALTIGELVELSRYIIPYKNS